MIESQIQPAHPEAPTVGADVPPVAAGVRPAKVGPAPWVRRLGNLLIAVGLLLMLGVGGYLGYQMYSTAQTTQAINAQHDAAAGLDLGLPAAPDSTSSGSTSSASSAPSNQVVVDQVPLKSLNTEPSIASFVGIAQTKPPIKIDIPSVGISSPVVPVGWEMIPGKNDQQLSRWKVAEYAAGHHDGTANPGQVGNVVISGHVDWKGEVFKNLHETKRGDEIHIYTEDREYLYIVQDIRIVLEDGASEEQKAQNAQFMDPTPDQTLTLITCYPYGIDDHRLIVIAKPYDSGLPARPDLVIK
ncbi:MAG TPA: sortase [Chloroflexia bacterium]|nr:sortase [Chloroflexia bacterium]